MTVTYTHAGLQISYEFRSFSFVTFDIYLCKSARETSIGKIISSIFDDSEPFIGQLKGGRNFSKFRISEIADA